MTETINKTVWIIDDDKSVRWVLQKTLQSEQYSVIPFASADDALNALDTLQSPDLVMTDIRMPNTSGLEFMKVFQKSHPNIPIIIMTAHSDFDTTILAYQGGAFEYILKPFDIEEVVTVVKRALTTSNTQNDPEKQAKEKLPEIIGNSAAMQPIFKTIARLSHTNANVLINGESGTGKELVAHVLHRHSIRKNQPFIAINMAAIPNDLLESELFGHEKGAFTGATSQRTGRFEQADTGTLFLDEIGDMPLHLQTRLLRVLSSGEFYRVGGHTPVKVNVRIIAATHQNLEQLVADKKFREDLFHRLNVIRLYIPPLRERKEDIPVLMQFFLDKASTELNENKKTLSKQALKSLQKEPWPGNVRQLENLCQRLMVLSVNDVIQVQDIIAALTNHQAKTPDIVSQDWTISLSNWAEQAISSGEENILETALPEFEKTLIKAALKKTNGKKTKAAKLLGCGRNTLTRKLKELKIK